MATPNPSNNELELIYKVISDVSLAGVIVLFLITLIIFRKPIIEFLKCKHNTDELINKTNTLIKKIDSKIISDKEIIENNEKSVNLVKEEIRNILITSINEFKSIITELKMSSTSNYEKFINIKEEISKVEKKLDKLTKLVQKYLDIDDLD